MAKLTFLVLGLLVLSATVMMVGVAPGARDTNPRKDAMDIRAIERTVDVNTLPKTDLDPAVYE